MPATPEPVPYRLARYAFVAACLLAALGGLARGMGII